MLDERGEVSILLCLMIQIPAVFVPVEEELEGPLLPRLTATRFDKQVGSGRTKPCFICAEDAQGKEIEVMVKWRDTGESTYGLLCEAFTSILACGFRFKQYQPYIVEITQGFVDTVPDATIREIMQKNLGLNLGIRKWLPGTTVWNHSIRFAGDRRQEAAKLLAFDAVIQNPDRRFNNPNFAILDDDIIIYDHEAAFSHFLSIFPNNPWEEACLRENLRDHALKKVLKKKDLIDIILFWEILSSLSIEKISTSAAEIPGEWGTSSVNVEKIETYLAECSRKFKEIRDQLITYING